jgi:hypothetical protein
LWKIVDYIREKDKIWLIIVIDIDREKRERERFRMGWNTHEKKDQ